MRLFPWRKNPRYRLPLFAELGTRPGATISRAKKEPFVYFLPAAFGGFSASVGAMQKPRSRAAPRRVTPFQCVPGYTWIPDGEWKPRAGPSANRRAPPPARSFSFRSPRAVSCARSVSFLPQVPLSSLLSSFSLSFFHSLRSSRRRASYRPPSSTLRRACRTAAATRGRQFTSGSRTGRFDARQGRAEVLRARFLAPRRSSSSGLQREGALNEKSRFAELGEHVSREKNKSRHGEARYERERRAYER